MQNQPVATVVTEAHFEQGRYIERQTLKIYPDDSPMDPRTENDNLGRMICFHGRYNLGDVGHGIDQTDFESWDELEDLLRKGCGATVILPLYMYDHSGITISCDAFHDKWDSGQVGFIYATRQDILNNFGGQRLTKNRIERTREILLAEVREYDDYLTGNVYGYTLEDANGVVFCSAWGYSGDDAIARIKNEVHMQENTDTSCASTVVGV